MQAVAVDDLTKGKKVHLAKLLLVLQISLRCTTCVI